MEYSISSAHGTFFRIDHILGHKTSLNKFQKIKILSSISDHSVVGNQLQEKALENWQICGD